MIDIGKMEALTRIGFAARGIMYFLIGYIAVRTGRTEDGSGAMAYLDSGAGRMLLALMSLGFLGYAVWRLSEALIDSEGQGDDGKGYAIRAGGAVSGAIHLLLAFTSASLAMNAGGGGGGGGSREGAATTLSLPGGQAIMIAIAAGLALTGLFQLVKAVRADFLRHLERGAAGQGWVKLLGRSGYAARGIVFLIMGWFAWEAASQSDASKTRHMGEALASLPGSLQVVVAAGLLLFGLFSLVEAVYRRINDPNVLGRLKGAVRSA